MEIFNVSYLSMTYIFKKEKIIIKSNIFCLIINFKRYIFNRKYNISNR